MNSHRATTTAVVTEVELDEADVGLAVAAYYRSGGLGSDVLGAEEFAHLVSETVLDVLNRGRWWPVGTVVGRRLDSVVLRTLPENGGRPAHPIG